MLTNLQQRSLPIPQIVFSIGLLLGALTSAVVVAQPAAQTDEPRPHGATQNNAAGTLQAWNAQSLSWMSIPAFWRDWADNHGGLRWGQGSVYPPYAEVQERDLFLVELETGPCLMEFWHRRWRRAQDVRRWSEAFNRYGGCPNVFD